MKKVLVIIPAHNEEKNIRKVLEDLKKEVPEYHCLVINDGSRDRTSKYARSYKKVSVIDLPFNVGIGGAVQTGFKYARKHNYDYALQFDGDGQHRAGEIRKIIEPLANQEADVVIGSRFLEREGSYKSTFMRRKGIYIFKLVNFLLIRQVITDNTSGFRAYNRNTIKFLASYYPTDYPEPESVVLLGRNGFKISEVSVDMEERKFGRSSIRGWRVIYYMLKVLLSILMTALRNKIMTRD